MKKLLLFLLPFSVFGQNDGDFSRLYVDEVITMGDNAVFKIMDDTLVNPAYVRKYVADNSPSGVVLYSDSTTKYVTPKQLHDSILAINIPSADTSDFSRNVDNADGDMNIQGRLTTNGVSNSGTLNMRGNEIFSNSSSDNVPNARLTSSANNMQIEYNDGNVINQLGVYSDRAYMYGDSIEMQSGGYGLLTDRFKVTTDTARFTNVVKGVTASFTNYVGIKPQVIDTTALSNTRIPVAYGLDFKGFSNFVFDSTTKKLTVDSIATQKALMPNLAVDKICPKDSVSIDICHGLLNSALTFSNGTKKLTSISLYDDATYHGMDIGASNYYKNGAWYRSTPFTPFTQYFDVDNGQISFWFASAGAVGTPITWTTPRVIIDSTGKVTADTIDTDKLRINGNYVTSISDVADVELGFINYEQLSAQWHRVDSINTPNTSWNNVKFTLNNSTVTKGITVQSDSASFVLPVGIYDIQACARPFNSGGASQAGKVQIRATKNSTGLRCAQGSASRVANANEFPTLPMHGKIQSNGSDTLRVQYKVSTANFDFKPDTDFDNPVSFTINITRISK
jgi:hypothetical protein